MASQTAQSETKYSEHRFIFSHDKPLLKHLEIDHFIYMKVYAYNNCFTVINNYYSHCYIYYQSKLPGLAPPNPPPPPPVAPNPPNPPPPCGTLPNVGGVLPPWARLPKVGEALDAKLKQREWYLQVHCIQSWRNCKRNQTYKYHVYHKQYSYPANPPPPPPVFWGDPSWFWNEDPPPNVDPPPNAGADPKLGELPNAAWLPKPGVPPKLGGAPKPSKKGGKLD